MAAQENECQISHNYILHMKFLAHEKVFLVLLEKTKTTVHWELKLLNLLEYSVSMS